MFIGPLPFILCHPSSASSHKTECAKFAAVMVFILHLFYGGNWLVGQVYEWKQDVMRCNLFPTHHFLVTLCNRRRCKFYIWRRADLHFSTWLRHSPTHRNHTKWRAFTLWRHNDFDTKAATNTFDRMWDDRADALTAKLYFQYSCSSKETQSLGMAGRWCWWWQIERKAIHVKHLIKSYLLVHFCWAVCVRHVRNLFVD